MDQYHVYDLDTVSPRIDLGGGIITGTVDSIIPNVTVCQIIQAACTLNKNARCDTAIIGSVYNYTYPPIVEISGDRSCAV